MKIETLEFAGLKSALKGMRNAKNSWDKSDSFVVEDYMCDKMYDCSQCKLSIHSGCTLNEFAIGDDDMKLAQTLIKGGSEHAKYRRMIQVWVDFDMPRYWWSEFDTYKIGTTANSCSTMHKLLNNQTPITLDMFVVSKEDVDIIEIIVNTLEGFRKLYLETRDDSLLIRAKRLLPEGFLQTRTVNTNYETIANTYHQRKHHRLKEEWIDTYCKWAESLPYAPELIIYTGR